VASADELGVGVVVVIEMQPLLRHSNAILGASVPSE